MRSASRCWSSYARCRGCPISATSSWRRMADVRGFRALHYAAPDLGPLLAPPYDVLTPEQVAEWAAHSPENVVRLTRPGEDYDGAARLLEQWLAAGVLV